MRHVILWWKRVHSHHLRINSPRGKRKMAPPQASPYPLWRAPWVCHLLVGPDQCIVYTCSWDQAREGRDTTAFLVDPTGIMTTTENGSCADALEAHSTGFFVRGTSSPGPYIRTLVLPMLTRSPSPSMLVPHQISFSCSTNSNSVMISMSSAHRFSHGHPVLNMWERASWTVMNSRDSAKSLGEHPLPHWTFQSGCHQHAICFWYFDNALYEPHQPLLNAKLAKSPPDGKSVCMIKCLFQINRDRVQSLVDGMELFCNWWIMIMAFVVLRAGMKPNCMSPMHTCHRKLYSSTLSRTLMTWSSNLRSR